MPVVSVTYCLWLRQPRYLVTSLPRYNNCNHGDRSWIGGLRGRLICVPPSTDYCETRGEKSPLGVVAGWSRGLRLLVTSTGVLEIEEWCIFSVRIMLNLMYPFPVQTAHRHDSRLETLFSYKYIPNDLPPCSKIPMKVANQ